jgi:molecular chaperone GrpE (heat shock protein)
MNKNIWILWAVILMIPGAIGLGYYFAQRNALQDRIHQAAEAVAKDAATDEYLNMYHRWVQLSAKEKAENPWGQGLYGGPDIQKRLLEGQSNRLLAALPELDKGVRRFPEELAITMYGSRWPQAVEDYHRQRSKAEMMLIGTVFLLAGGGLILIGGLGKIALVYSLSRFRRDKDHQPEEEVPADTVKADESPQPPHGSQDESFQTAHIPFMEMQPVSDAEKLLGASRKTDKPQDDNTEDNEKPGYFESRKKVAQKKMPVSDAPAGSLGELSKSLSGSLAFGGKTSKDSYFGWALREEEASSLETLMTTEPLTKELNELTEEVSAIRQFAAQQQDQVRKLQDGYDWMIIRRFCMRIIRSIDNIEDRVARQEDPESDITRCLTDIRDELIFALESSGIEQYIPEINIPYKGLEKYAEAVRQRIPTDDGSLCGCIAEIVRPGYQYLISDDDVKIVRCAQVKLYDAK